MESTICVVDNLENIDQRISRGPFTYLAASPNGKNLALLSYSGLLWVVSTDFQRSLAEFNTKEVVGVDGPVKQVQWCANDAVIVSWDGLVLLVGPFGDTLQLASFTTCSFKELNIPADISTLAPHLSSRNLMG